MKYEETDGKVTIQPDVVLPEMVDAVSVAAIDTAINKANAYYITKHWSTNDKPPVTLYWTPTCCGDHSKVLGYFIVWACDNRRSETDRGRLASYFFFKGMLGMWETHYSEPSKYDEIEAYVIGLTKEENEQ